MKVSFSAILASFTSALAGVPVTLKIVAVSFLVAFVLGFLMAVVNKNRVPVLSQISKVFISFMRGTPIIVQIFLIYNSLPSLLNAVFVTFGVPIDIFDVDPIFYAIAVFALSETAILAEIFRAALNGVDNGQLEAAECVGLTIPQGYLHIILPQALASAVPVLGNAVTDLIKTTSLAFSMSILDVTGIAKIQGAASLDYIDAYLAVALIYLILVLIFENAFKLLERRLNAHTQPLNAPAR